MRDQLERLSESSIDGNDELAAALEQLRVKSDAAGRRYLAFLLKAAVDEARTPDRFHRFSATNDTYH